MYAIVSLRPSSLYHGRSSSGGELMSEEQKKELEHKKKHHDEEKKPGKPRAKTYREPESSFE